MTPSERIEQEIAGLRLRLGELEGKANKKERTAVNKELYRLENSPEFVESLRAERDLRRDALEAEEAATAAEAASADTTSAATSTQIASKPLSRMGESHYRQQVETLFDEYSDHFETALCVDLHYKTPSCLQSALFARADRTTADREEGVLSRLDTVDFGCGTGLMGVELRKHCKGRILGCDLSARMLQVARTKHAGIYDELAVADCVSYLRRLSPGTADLVVGADVCVYMRSLEDLCGAAQRVLCVGGVLAFSTEACRLDEVEGGVPPSGLGWVERASERIAHCAEYHHWLATLVSSELDIVSVDEADIREDAGGTIRGHLVLMVKR